MIILLQAVVSFRTIEIVNWMSIAAKFVNKILLKIR